MVKTLLYSLKSYALYSWKYIHYIPFYIHLDIVTDIYSPYITYSIFTESTENSEYIHYIH